MTAIPTGRRSNGRRALRQSLAWCFRRLPQWSRGRLRVGSGLDRILARSGYGLWHEDVGCTHGVRMCLDTDEPQQRQIYWTGSYDRLTVETLVDSLPEDGVLLDVGAGIGGIVLFVVGACARAGKTVSAHAFEPLEQNYERLLRNVSLNDQGACVRCHRLALGAHEGTLGLCYSGGAGAAAVVRSGDDIAGFAGDRSECVPCDTLDGWAENNGLTRIDVLKIDVEGAEPLMFRGGMRTIERFLPVIVGEFNHWWAARHGLSMVSDCFEPLWDLGYRTYRPIRRHSHWQPVTGRPAAGPEMEDTLWIPPRR